MLLREVGSKSVLLKYLNMIFDSIELDSYAMGKVPNTTFFELLSCLLVKITYTVELNLQALVSPVHSQGGRGCGCTMY